MANLNRTNDFQESFTSFFLTSMSYESKNNNFDKDQSLVNVIKEMFTRSGVSLHGVEAFRIHNELFTNIFIKHQNTYSILPDEFFCLVLDEDINWLSFLVDIVNSLRLPDVNVFVCHVLTFVNDHLEINSHVSVVKLLVLGLTVVNTMVLDLLIVPYVHINGENSAVKKNFEKKVEQFQQNSVELTQLYIQLLQLSLKHFNSNQCNLLEDTYNQFIHLVCLALVVLDPHSVEADIKQLLRSLLGRETMRTEKETTVNKKVRLCGYEKLKKQIPQNHTDLAKVDESMQTKCDQTFSPIRTVIKCMKDQTLPSLYCDLLSFLCSVDNFSSSALTPELYLRVGHHVLDGHCLTKQGLKIIMYYLNRSADQSNYLPDEFPDSTNQNADANKFGKSEIEVFPEPGCSLSSQDDLNRLIAVITNREPGWKDLLILGLNNTDILHWWKKGFYELVCLNESVLRTEANVKLLFKICCEAYQHHRDLNITSLLQQLFKRIFHGLSAELQEQVVLSIITSRDGSENMVHGQMTDDAILSELIPLFNKLTKTIMNQVVSVMLYLCVYNSDLVIQQSVLVAIGNKAQVELIVDLLRRCPSLCKTCPPHLQYSRLVQACLEVLKNCQIDENITKNTAHFLTQLVQSYELVLDCQLNFKLDGLMSPNDVVKYFLLPHLTRCISTGHRALITHTTPEIYTSFSLHILQHLLTTIEKSEVLYLDPFPLLAVLADLYVDSCFVFDDGQLDTRLVTIKQSSQICIQHLMRSLAECTKYFSVSSFHWLKKYALSSGWLHLALMKPTLEHCCDLELQRLLAYLIREQPYNVENSLGLLLQLACVTVVNDEMLTEVQNFLHHVKLTSSHSIMLILTKQMLLIALPSEVQRFLKLLIILVQSQGFNISNEINCSLSSTSTVYVSQLMSNAVVLLFSEISCQSALCHLINNYITATQVLTQDITMVTTLFCHHCAMLSHITGHVSELLQMSALDLMMKLKSFSGPLSLEKSKLLDYVQCVKKESVRMILMKHIQQ